MKVKFKWLGICALSLTLTSCFYVDYAVDKTKVNLPYRTYYYSDSIKNSNVDFTTVIYSQDKDIQNQTNYTNFTIYINHLNRDIHGRYDYRTSEICFDDPKNIDLNIESIQLTYQNANAQEVPFIIQAPIKNPNSGLIECFRQSYTDDQLTKTMTEHIFIKFKVNNKSVTIQQTYPLKKVLHYTLWEVLMGV